MADGNDQSSVAAGGVVLPRPLDKAKAISTLISEQADASERLGRLTDKASQALLDANLFSITLPRLVGGHGSTRSELFETVEEIARADGSAGWCVGLCNGINAFIYAGATADARHEIFGNGPVCCWSSLSPVAKSVEDKGGFSVTGNFVFGSGCSFSRWVIVASRLNDRDGQQWFRAHLVPKADVEIKEGSWSVMGLQATASLDYAISGKLVPAYRTFEYPFLQAKDRVKATAMVMMQSTQLAIVAFASGVGSRALAELVAVAPKTKRTSGEGMQSEDNVVQFGVGEIEGRLRAARAYYLSLLSAQDAELTEGRSLHPELVLNTTQAALTVTRAARDAAIFAFDSGGTGSIRAASPLQRCLRDVFTGLKHANVNQAFLGRIGKVRLGLEYGSLRL